MEIWAVKNKFPLDFANIYVRRKCKRTAKLLMFRSNFRKKGVCYKSATLYWDKFW